MKSYFKLSLLLLGVSLLTARCEMLEELEDDEPGEGEEDPAWPTEEGEEEEDFEELDGVIQTSEEQEEEDDEPRQPEKKVPLSSEQMYHLHKKMDANGNGKVTLVEATEFAQEMRRSFAKKQLLNDLEQMDTDTDEKVSLEEFLAHFQKGADEQPQNAGPTEEEKEQFVEEQRTEFRAADKDSDGYVDMDELAQMHHHYVNDKVETELSKPALKERDQDGNGELSLHEFFGIEDEDVSEEDQELFGKLDKDGSDTINNAEFKPWMTTGFDSDETAKTFFATANKDNDDSLTAEEMAKASGQIADEHHQTHLFLLEWHEHEDEPSKHDEL